MSESLQGHEADHQFASPSSMDLAHRWPSGLSHRTLVLMNRGSNPGGDNELFTSCNMRDCMQFTSSLSVEDWDIRLPLI